MSRPWEVVGSGYDTKKEAQKTAKKNRKSGVFYVRIRKNKRYGDYQVVRQRKPLKYVKKRGK